MIALTRTKHGAGLAGSAAGGSALSWAAVSAASAAVFAWAACCVIPLSLALTGLGLGGLSWVAGHRIWLTVLALAVVAAGWILRWRQARACRTDGSCAVPSPAAGYLLGAATVLILLALIWQPIVEPRALMMIRSARG